MSWATDLSPTAIFSPLYMEYATVAAGSGVERVYPGWWDEGWPGGVLYRYPGPALQNTHIQSYLRLGPYPRPNEGLLRYIDEVS